jgi:hypothetical protein
VAAVGRYAWSQEEQPLPIVGVDRGTGREMRERLTVEDETAEERERISEAALGKTRQEFHGHPDRIPIG